MKSALIKHYNTPQAFEAAYEECYIEKSSSYSDFD